MNRIHFRALDQVCSVEVDDEALPLLDLLADLVSEPGEAARGWRLTRHGHEWRLYDGLALAAAAEDWPPLAAKLMQLVNGAALDDRLALAVHGAALGLGDRVAVVPGASRLGKTTLSAAGLGAGLTYLTDEALAFTPSAGHLTPYPRPLALDASSVRVLGLPPGTFEHDGESWYVASGLGQVAATCAPREVTDVVLVDRRPGAADIATGSRSLAAERLLRQSFNHYKDSRSAFLTVTELVQRCSVWALSYQDAPEGASLLAEQLST